MSDMIIIGLGQLRSPKNPVKKNITVFHPIITVFHLIFTFFRLPADFYQKPHDMA